MKKFKTHPVPNRATDMEFDEWSAMEEPTFMLPEVWVRVTGIPSDVRNDYIALWALGSLFGKTMEVDMAFTRKNKVLRLRIGCMDASLIPETSDVYISRGFSRLGFEVENKNSNVEIEMVEEVHNDGNNDDRDGGNDEDGRNGSNRDEITHMEVQQTMNPGTNRDGIGENRNNANVENNSLTVNFGTLHPPPLKEEVSLPCVFTAAPGVLMNSEGTAKIEPKQSSKYESKSGSQAQNDRTGADFEMNLLRDPVPIIACRPIIVPSESS
jgi:hypothetical protein